MSGHALNAQQVAAVEHDAGPLIVLAGPGTGKTNVIVHRVCHMIEHRGIDPERIVALTFTNEAARELRERLSALVGGSAADRLNASTFHSFGLSLLRRFSDLTGLGPRLALMDSAQHRRLTRHLIQEHGLFRDAMAGGIASLIDESRAIIAELRNSAMEPEACAARVEAMLSGDAVADGQRAEIERFSEHVRLYGLIDAACRRRGLISMDELLTRPIGLLREHRVAREICQHDHHHVVVDEFQDQNIAQMELLGLLCPAQREKLDLCVVGDDDQAIYAFRGANQFAFEHFKRRWPTATTLFLELNYRSARCVIEAANQVIGASEARFAPDKVIVPASEAEEVAGAAVEVVRVASDFDSDGLIAAMLLTERERDPERVWSSYAVIGRTNREVERIAATLRLEDIPVRVRSMGSPLDDEGVQDLLAWIRAVLEPSQTWAVRRLLLRPPYGLGASRVSAWERSYAAAMSRAASWEAEPFLQWLTRTLDEGDDVKAIVSRLAMQVEAFRASATTESADVTIERMILEADLAGADLVGGRSRAGRIESLVAVLRFVRERLGRLEAPADLAAFWSYYNDLDPSEQSFSATLDTRVEWQASERSDDEDGVVLLTAHSAKGLEFDTVFLPRVNPPHGYPMTSRKRESVLPTGIDANVNTPGLLEEERRLFYVACTRAKRRLIMFGKIPKGKPGTTNLLWPLISAGVVSERDPAQIMRDAAAAGVTSAAWSNEPVAAPSGIGRLERATVLAQARSRLRHEASLALDGADRAGLDRAAVEEVMAKLASVATRMAVLASIGAGESGAAELGAEAAEYRARVEDKVLRTGARPGFAFVAPKPPLNLSYTMLRDYEHCPRCFYLRHVMKLSQGESGAIRVGQVTHTALEKFYRRWMDAEAQGEPRPTLEHLLELGLRTFDASVSEHEVMDTAQRDQILAALTIAHTKLHNEALEPLEVEKNVNFPFEHNGLTHRIYSKLDRIDRIEGGFRIVDYKTGHASKGLLEPDKKDLQLGIYALALRHLFGDEQLTGTAEYWVLSQGERGVIGLDQLDMEAIGQVVRGAIDGILEGRFERNEKNCEGECSLIDLVVRDAAE